MRPGWGLLTFTFVESPRLDAFVSGVNDGAGDIGEAVLGAVAERATNPHRYPGTMDVVSPTLMIEDTVALVEGLIALPGVIADGISALIDLAAADDNTPNRIYKRSRRATRAIPAMAAGALTVRRVAGGRGGRPVRELAGDEVGALGPQALATGRRHRVPTPTNPDDPRVDSRPDKGRVDTSHSGPRGFDNALAAARANAGELGTAPRRRMYDPNGTLIGEQTADALRGWRIDGDHVNWWDWTDGRRGRGGRSGHEWFPADVDVPHSRYIRYAPEVVE